MKIQKLNKSAVRSEKNQAVELSSKELRSVIGGADLFCTVVYWGHSVQ